MRATHVDPVGKRDIERGGHAVRNGYLAFGDPLPQLVELSRATRGNCAQPPRVGTDSISHAVTYRRMANVDNHHACRTHPAAQLVDLGSRQATGRGDEQERVSPACRGSARHGPAELRSHRRVGSEGSAEGHAGRHRPPGQCIDHPGGGDQGDGPGKKKPRPFRHLTGGEGAQDAPVAEAVAHRGPPGHRRVSAVGRPTAEVPLHIRQLPYPHASESVDNQGTARGRPVAFRRSQTLRNTPKSTDVAD